MNFTDAAQLTGTRRTSDGYLVTSARAVRTGIQLYAGSEMGMADKAIVRVYRPEAEVRSPSSLQSFSHAPVTMGHPSQAVTSDNWKDLAIGEVSTAAKWEDDHISLPLILKDAVAIAAVEAGTRELSAGYTCTIDATPGITPQGEAYDAVQRDIVINHLAVVPRGRAGTTRIPDAAPWGLAPVVPTADTKGSLMADTLQTVVLGDQAAQVAIADAPKIEAFKASTAKALQDAQSAHDAAIATKDAELATKDAAIADLKAKVLTDAALDALVADRASLISTAKAIHDAVITDGKSGAEIKKATVIAKAGAEMADKSEAYIDAMFDILAKQTKADPAVAALMDGAGKKTTTTDELYIQRDKALQDAWKTPSKGSA